MTVLVAYMSLTGNTKRIAETIFQEIQQDMEIKELTEIESLKDYDFAFIGFPMHGFGVAEIKHEVGYPDCSENPSLPG